MPIRYAIKMKNGDYLKSDFVGSLERVHVTSTEGLIEADLFKEKNMAVRALEEILDGSANLFVTYDEDNPPEKVVKFKIHYDEVQCS